MSKCFTELHAGLCIHSFYTMQGQVSYSSPPLKGTSLLPNNFVLVREVSFGERKDHIYSWSLLPRICVLSRRVSSLGGCPLREGDQCIRVQYSYSFLNLVTTPQISRHLVRMDPCCTIKIPYGSSACVATKFRCYHFVLLKKSLMLFHPEIRAFIAATSQDFKFSGFRCIILKLT